MKVDDPSVDLSDFPNFLIVGPQRTGTSWLYQNLFWHPEILLSHPKELFFFNSLQSRGAKFRSDRLDWYLQFFRNNSSSKSWLRKQELCITKYREPYRPKMRGEATASYAYLDEEIIREITALNPGIRIIMMIRHPIDRAWSHAKRYFTKVHGRQLDHVTPEEMETFFRDLYQLACTQYVRNMDRWLSFIQDDALFIGWFDDLHKNPRGLLLDIFTFLGVKTDEKYIRSDSARVIGATLPVDIPQFYKVMLESLLAEDIHQLENRFGVRFR